MKKSLKRWIGLGLAVVLGAGTLTGCASSSSGSGSASSGETPAAASADGKGRYVEQVMSLPFEDDSENVYTSIYDTRVISGDKLRMLVERSTYTDDDYQTGVYVFDSEDNGRTWTQVMDLGDMGILKAEDNDEEETYVNLQSAAISPEGNLFLLVSESRFKETRDGSTVTSTGSERNYYYTVKADGTIGQINIDAPELPSERTWDYTYDENEVYAEDAETDDAAVSDDDEIEVHEGGEDKQSEEMTAYINKIIYADEDNLYILTDQSGIFHVSVSDGRILGHAQDLPYIYNAAISGDELIVSSWDTVCGYDLASGNKTKEYPEFAKVMQDARGAFIIGDSTEKGKIYYVSSEGVFSYDLNSNEQMMMVDGKLTSLGSVDTNINLFEALPNNDFLIYLEDYSSRNSSSRQLLYYTFDPEMSARPDKTLTVYALAEDYSYMAEQICAMFRKAHPDIYVNIEYGMSGDDAVTSSDAIRTLNTRVMADEGPDIIFLDGLPIDSYVEKGLLLDISEIVDAKKQDGLLFEPVADTYKLESGTFAVPSTFSVPVMVAKNDMLDKIKTVGDLADAAENYAADSSRGKDAHFMDSYNLFTLIANLMPTNAGSWFNDDGSLDADALKAYLTDVKRLTEAVKSGMNEEDAGFLSQMMDYLKDEDMQQFFTYSSFSGSDPSWDAVEVASGTKKIALGHLGGADGLQYLYSANKKTNDIGFASMPGTMENVFIPGSSLGINAKTKDPESAKAFIDYVLSTDMQKYLGNYNGFPVNKEAFDKCMEDPNKGNPGYKEGESYGSAGTMDEFGNMMEIEMYWPDQAYIEEFKNRLSEMTIPAYNDDMILTTILKDCIGCTAGDDDIDAAVEQVMKDINIYLSE